MNSLVELLEHRIAPASLIGTDTVQWTDVDGDVVQMTVNKGEFTKFDFSFVDDAGDPIVNPFSELNKDAKMTLSEANLSDAAFFKTNISVEVVTADGNGEAEVGFINAAENDLRKVEIDGTLVAIDAGSVNSRTAIQVLEVGQLGTDDLAHFGSVENYARSDISGSIGKLTINGDLLGSLKVDGGLKNDVNKIEISGSVIADDGDNSFGQIYVESGKINKLQIGEDVDASQSVLDTAGQIITQRFNRIDISGSVVGGGGESSGAIRTINGNIGKVDIGGSLVGGDGESSGMIFASNGNINKVFIGTQGGGDLEGGDGKFSGSVIANGNLRVVSVNGDVIGGGGIDSGAIYSETGNINKVDIAGNLEGGDKINTGQVRADAGNINKVTIDGSIIGGDGKSSGGVFAENGRVNRTDVGVSIEGGNGEGSGFVRAEILNKVTIGQDDDGKSLVGGMGEFSGMIFAQDFARKVVLDGDVIGGDNGANAGYIAAETKLNRLDIGGLVQGGSGEQSGSIQSGQINKLTINEDVKGADGVGSGSILIGDGGVRKLSINGSLLGGQANQTGAILSAGALKNVSIGMDLVGGDNALGNVAQAGTINASEIRNLSIDGDVMGGMVEDGGNLLTDAGSIRSGSTINKLQIGAILGGDGEEDNRTTVVITADSKFKGSAKNDRVINRVDVDGNMEFGLILAGYDATSSTEDLNGTNPHAQINKVSIGADVIDSSIAAGVLPNKATDFFGVNDTLIPGAGTDTFSRIAKIIVDGSVSNTSADPDATFGFVSSDFNRIIVGGDKLDIPAAGGSEEIQPNFFIHRANTLV